MKKYTALLIAFVMVLSFASCSKSEPAQEPAANSDTASTDAAPATEESTGTELTGELEGVKTAIAEELGLEGIMPIELEAACTIYTLDANLVKDFAAFTMMEGTFPHEVVMVEAKDAKAVESIKDSLNIRLEAFRDQAKGYSPEDYALAEKCQIEINGNHVAMFLSPKCDEMKAIYAENIK